jgi:hypothetical protein
MVGKIIGIKLSSAYLILAMHLFDAGLQATLAGGALQIYNPAALVEL